MTNDKTDRELLEHIYICLCGDKELGIEGIICWKDKAEKRIGRIEILATTVIAVLTFLGGVAQYFKDSFLSLFKGG